MYGDLKTVGLDVMVRLCVLLFPLLYYEVAWKTTLSHMMSVLHVTFIDASEAKNNHLGKKTAE